METNVFNIEGKETGKLSLPVIFNVKANPALMHEIVVGHLANQRAGTHSTKTRGEVSGGGIKPWRQKGTGRARSGSIRSPLWRKGGIIFGPKPRSYYQNLSQRKRRQVLDMALSEKAKSNNIVIVENLLLKEPKTKLMLKILNNLNIADQKVLLIGVKRDTNIARASRNIKNLVLKEYKNINAYEVLWADKVVFIKDVFDNLGKEVSE